MEVKKEPEMKIRSEEDKGKEQERHAIERHAMQPRSEAEAKA